MKKVFFAAALSLLGANVFSQAPEVIYHVFQRSFFDSDGDQNGDLKGVQDKLDYLQDLGVTSILLTPLYQSGFYHNYFADDFEKIDPDYGSMEDYLSLVREVHKRKMKIYQDVEMQYVTHRHPWFSGSYRNPASPFDRYVYYNDEQNEKPWYFWGIEEFTVYDNSKHKVVVVNMNEPAVRKYTFEMLKHWLDPDGDNNFDDGVDGFRLDHMMDDLDNSGKLVNLFSDFWTPILGDLRRINPSIRIIAEQANWASLGFDYLSRGSVDRVFAFRLKFAIDSFDKKRIGTEADSAFLFAPEGKDPVVFIENHDTGRFGSVARDDGQLKVGAALNVLLGGTPLIYYGQELGMKGKQLHGATDGNDIPVREAFEWNKSGTGPGTALWYKDTGVWWDSTNIKPNDGISLEEQKHDPNSLFQYYKKLIATRRSHPALWKGNYRPLSNSNDRVLSFMRTSAEETVVVVVNLSGEQQAAELDSQKGTLNAVLGEVLVNKKQKSWTFILPPYRVAVYRVK